MCICAKIYKMNDVNFQLVKHDLWKSHPYLALIRQNWSLFNFQTLESYNTEYA